MLFKMHSRLCKGLFLMTALPLCLMAQAHATPPGSKAPSLIVTSDPLPDSLKRQIYSKPTQVQTIKPEDIISDSYYQPTRTDVGAKVGELSSRLRAIQGGITGISGTLSGLQRENQELSARYYSNVATINTQLQSGTTPGNPRLVGRLQEAESQLESLGSSVGRLNSLAQDAASVASEASFLLQEARAAYTISGAVEEDHVALAQLEDNINGTLVVIERVMNMINDDITRTSTYMSSERNNMRALALGVTNGDLYGRSLANRPISGAPETAGATAMPASYTPGQDVSAANAGAPLAGGARPLVKIRFDKPDVNYEQPVYMALNDALQRYPNARFELVAVHPTKGNAAEVAIESTKARRNAEKVMRSLTQMGMPMERIDLSYNADAAAATNEVHLYIK